MNFDEMKKACEGKEYDEMLNIYMTYYSTHGMREKSKNVQRFIFLPKGKSEFEDVLGKYNLDSERIKKEIRISKEVNISGQTFVNWLNGTVLPTKEKLAELSFFILKNYERNDHVAIHNDMLKAAGYGQLHAANPKESLLEFCLRTKKDYDYYKNIAPEIARYAENVPLLRNQDALSYTTHYLNDELEKVETESGFYVYLERYTAYLSAQRNKTVKNLSAVLGIGERSVRQIAIGFEKFYLNNQKTDIITMNPRRENHKPIHTIMKPMFRTDKTLADIVQGKTNVIRNEYIAWLIFAGVSESDIDMLLCQSDYMPIMGYEEQNALSSIVSFAFFVSGKTKKAMIDVLKDLYDKFDNTEMKFKMHILERYCRDNFAEEKSSFKTKSKQERVNEAVKRFEKHYYNLSENKECKAEEEELRKKYGRCYDVFVEAMKKEPVIMPFPMYDHR